MATDTDIAQSDLAELLRILGMGDHARPQSPHEVFQEALGVLRQRLAELDRWRGLSEAIGKTIGAAEGWPAHGNAPLAIAATVQLLQTEVTRNIQPKPLSEWTEEDGDVLWWRFPIEEPPYCGSPQDLGHTVELHTHDSADGPRIAARCSIGGWPGGYTHWTRIPEIWEP